MEMRDIHEAVLKHLLDNKQEGFSLRSKDNRNEEKLSKGYWFLGNDDSLNFSFWNSKDWRNKTPNIFMRINSEGESWLEFVDKDDSEKARFFEEIAPIIGLKQLKTKRNDEERLIWKKEYAHKANYIKSLDEFLQKDKPIIDAFIQAKGKTALFPPISKEDFKENLNNIFLRHKSSNLEEIELIYTALGPHISRFKFLPLRLKKAIFENIGHFKYIELNLDKQVTCLIGENGSGKSSILRGIALGLAGINDNTVIDPNNQAIQKMLRIDRIDGDREVYVPKGQINISYSSQKFQEANATNIINFTRQHGETVDKKGNIRSDFNIVEDGLNSDLSATTENYFTNLFIGFSQLKTLEDYQDNSQNGNGDLKPRISEVTSLIYNHSDKSFHKFSSWILKIWSAKTSEKERQLKIKVLESIFSTIHKIVGGTFELMPMQIEQTDIFVKTTDAPEGIPLHLISQGYNNVIGWVGYFMQRLWEVTHEDDKIRFKHTPAICLIDEIDTYLHPKWEKTILSVLAEEFPNTQFVVTTHSPLIITHLQNTNNTAAIYHVSEQGIKQIQASGQDISTAMLMHFGIERRPIFYQNQIDKLFSNIEKFEESSNGMTIEILEKQLADLKTILGDIDPDIETAERILETFKISID
jgi:predicted ATP-binding protein involved in virulence